MITIHPSKTLGYADLGWLKSKHHFSFADYYNPDRMEFGKLRVINDDFIKAGSGFDMHQHKDMEIITFVRSGAITHKDSRGNQGRTGTGNVQVMSAGSGIFHSEYNLESEDTTIYQIWIQPNKRNVEPRWGAAEFSSRTADKELPLLVSGRPEDAEKDVLFIHQDAAIFGGQMKSGAEITQSIKHQAYLLVSSGEIEILGKVVCKGDGVEIADQDTVTIKALTDTEVILIDVPR